MTKGSSPLLSSVHRALADPMRIRLFEYLSLGPRSVKELAQMVSQIPDRIYYHIALLEKAKLIEVAEYRRLPRGKVERVYQVAPIEPPGDKASPTEIANFLNAMLEATQADVTAAGEAQEAGEKRNTFLQRTAVRLSEADLNHLREEILELLSRARDASTEGNTWTRIVVTFIDLQDRNLSAG